jgi:hypothetical protein
MKKQVKNHDFEHHLRKNDLHTFAYLYLSNKGTLRDMKDLPSMGQGILGGGGNKPVAKKK